MTQQNALFRRYADLAANAPADFRNLVYEVGEGPAMLRFLTGEDSTQGPSTRTTAASCWSSSASASPTRPAGRTTPRPTCWRPRAPPPDGRSTTTTRTPRRPSSPSPAGTRARRPSSGKTGTFNHRQLVDVVLVPPEPRAVPGHQALGRVHPHRAGPRHPARPHERLPAPRLPAEAAGAPHPDPPGDARVDQGADHDQDAGGLRDRGDAVAGPGDHRRDALQRPARHGPAARTSRRPSPAGRAARPGSTPTPPCRGSGRPTGCWR